MKYCSSTGRRNHGRDFLIHETGMGQQVAHLHERYMVMMMMMMMSFVSGFLETVLYYWWMWIRTVNSQPEYIEATAERLCQFAMRTFSRLRFIETCWITIILQLSPSLKTGVNYLWHRKLLLSGGGTGLDKIADERNWNITPAHQNILKTTVTCYTNDTCLWKMVYFFNMKTLFQLP